MTVVLSTNGWMAASMAWILLALFAITLLHVVSPTLLAKPKHSNALYAVLMALAVIGLAPPITPPDRLFMMSLCVLGFVRVPAVCMATEPALVAFCNFGPFLMVLLRATVEGIPFSTAVICAEVSGFFVTSVSAVLLQVSLRRSSSESLRHQQRSTELRAASSLLGLTCDAVIELDQDLRLVEHSTELAPILLQSSSDLKGCVFTDFMPSTEEAERAAELLRRFDNYPPESINTQTFHTRFVDSCSSKFRSEVHQVMYTVPGRGRGKFRHLLGVRDVSDKRSIASPDAMSVSERQPSYTLLTPSIFTPNSQLPGLPVAHTEAQAPEPPAIEHKRLLSLEIDMERKSIAAASKPAFVGKRLVDIFSEPGLAVLEQAWVTACSEGGADKAISFQKLELRLSSSIRDSVDGILEVAMTETGDLHMMLRCLLTPTLAAAQNLPRSNSRSLLVPVPEAVQGESSTEATEFVNVNF